MFVPLPNPEHSALKIPTFLPCIEFSALYAEFYEILLPATLQGRYHFYPLFTDEEAET